MDFLDKYQSYMLSILRIVAALLFLDEGCAKVFHWPHFANFDNLVLGSWPEGIAGPLEVIFGTMILFGFYSRIASFLASGEMAIAYFYGHMFADGQVSIHPFINKGSLAVLYCFVFLYIACVGPGPWTINKK